MIELNSIKKRKILIFIFLIGFIIIASGQQVHAAINNTINFQTRITNKTSGLSPVAGSPACVSAGADTCDFRIRIWNVVSGGTATAGNNLLYEELFTNIEIGDYSGRLDLKINSVCGAVQSGNHSWGSTVASATVCNLFDDNADSDSITGVNFDRSDLYLELTFDPGGTWTTLASPPGGIETFTRTPLSSVPTAFDAQTLSGATGAGFVQLSPTAVQTTSSTTPAIWVLQQGSGNVIQLQKSGVDFFVVDNNDQLLLSQTGSTAGLLIGGSSNLYRSAADTLKTDGGITIATDFTVDGLSDFKGDLRGQLSDGDASTTTSGTGTSTKTLVVVSTTNFTAGNLVLINGTTYARIENALTSGQMRLSTAVSWSAGQTVVEKVLPRFGDSSSVTLSFDNFFVNNSLRAGVDTTGTTYRNGVIDSPVGLAITSQGSVEFTGSGSLSLNTTNGININKNQKSDVTGSWSVGAPGGIGRAANSGDIYNGKWYLWGGTTGVSIVNSLSIYDILSNTWSSGASGGTARRYHNGVISNGKFYNWGGEDSGGTAINTMDIYDIASNTWSTGASGGTARRNAGAVVSSGKIYFWGGSSGSFLNTLDIYDIATNTWSTGAAGGTARTYPATVLYNNRIYNWGGSNGSNLNTLDIYDIATNTWSTGAAGGTARVYHSGTVYNGKFYNWGGAVSGVTFINTMDIYDISSNTWSSGTAGGTGRGLVASMVYSGKWYFWGGFSPTLNTMDIYDFGKNDAILTVNVGSEQRLKLDTNNVLTISGKPLGLNYVTNESSQFTTQAWTTGSSTGNVNRNLIANSAIVYNDKMYLWGGSDGVSIDYNTFSQYNFATDTWTSGLFAGGTGRDSHSMQLYNGKAYIWGGEDVSFTPLNTMDIYDFTLNTWTTGATGGTAREEFSSVLYNGKIYNWGGDNGGAGSFNTMDIYDIASNTWTTGATGGTARRRIKGVEYNGKIYNWGGTTSNVNSTTINTLDIYDIASNTWTTGTAGGTARRDYIAVVFNGKIYNWGGFNSASTVLNTMDIYDITSNTWSTGTAGGTARGTVGAVVYNGKFYVASGSTGAGATNTLNIYDLGTSKSEEVFYISNNSSSGNPSGPENGKLFRFDATGRAYTSTQGGWFAVGADYAEYMHTDDTSISFGDIVSLKPDDGKSIIKAKEGDASIVGVISTQPGFVGNITNVEDINNDNPNYKLMSMVGQVPVKVKGDISIGDRITASDLPGVGRKAKDGEVNIGIAQESHYGDGVDEISLLMTRNNDGINNKIQIDFGRNSEGGFRVSGEGKLQFKDKDSDWKNISDSTAISNALLWEQKGDNVFSVGNSKVAIGLKNADSSASRLQVGDAFESRDGLNFIKVSSKGNITFNREDIGFRVNETTNTIEFKDDNTSEWRALSGLVISRIRFEKDTQLDILNQVQFNGWGYIQSDGNSTVLLKTINLPVEYNYQPIVSLGIIGQSSIKPETVSDCSEVSSISKASVSEVSKTSFIINLTAPVEVGKYYCYTWLAN